jgi:hypothetical protein
MVFIFVLLFESGVLREVFLFSFFFVPVNYLVFLRDKFIPICRLVSDEAKLKVRGLHRSPFLVLGFCQRIVCAIPLCAVVDPLLFGSFNFLRMHSYLCTIGELP